MSRKGPCSTANHQSDFRFGKNLRIRKRREFLVVQTGGRNQHSPHFIVISFNRPGLCRPRLGVTVSRKIGNAIVRNRVKRCIREFFRLHWSGILPARDIVFIAKSGAEKLSYGEIAKELGGALDI